MADRICTLPAPPRGKAPSLDEIADAWMDQDDLLQVFPHFSKLLPDWGSPFCFRCGWQTPKRASDYPANWKAERSVKAAWKAASGWLERAHLHDHRSGGSADALNLVPLCVLCHEEQPACGDRDAGIAFVESHCRREELRPYLQILTDRLGYEMAKPGKAKALRVMLRAHARVAEVMCAELKRHFAEEHPGEDSPV